MGSATKRFLLAVLFASPSPFIAPRPASAIPVFARKYETSCQTCHVAFPKLTPFGEAFRRNGYRWPAGEEEDATQDEPVPLGQEAHKKVFPDAVWPGELPGKVPLSAQLGSSLSVKPNADEAKLDFGGFGGSLGLNLAGTFDDTFSVWAGGEFEAESSGETAVELERVFTVIQPLNSPVLSFRVGRFEAGASQFTVHRILGIAPWYLITPVADSSFSLDPTHIGVEADGVIEGRVAYTVGLVEGSGILNTPKDAYLRVGYKLGGMRLDGVGGAKQSDPWSELSVELGAFGYLGSERIGVVGVAEQDDPFTLVGGDVNVLLNDLNILGAFVYQRDSHPVLAEPDEAAKNWHAFVQADYVVFPWLIPTARYEHRDLAGVGGDRVSGGIYTLVRANIRAQVLAAAADEGDGFDFDELTAGLRMAF